MSDLIDRAALRVAIDGIAPSWTSTIGAKFARNRILEIIDSQPGAPSPALTREALEKVLGKVSDARWDAILSALGTPPPATCDENPEPHRHLTTGELVNSVPPPSSTREETSA